jgi:hypothetical protein
MNSYRNYRDEVMTMLSKDIIFSVLDNINYYLVKNNSEHKIDSTYITDKFDILINILIVNGKTLTDQHASINKISDIIIQFSTYSKISKAHLYKIHVAFKILTNIKVGVTDHNINYRIINNKSSFVMPIAIESRIAIENKVKNMEYTKQYIKPQKNQNKRFKVDEIIGARDIEYNWWLARVLHIYNDPHSPELWYYVKYEGWGVIHNDWVSSRSHRIQKFNPYKHILKRPDTIDSTNVDSNNVVDRMSNNMLHKCKILNKEDVMKYPGLDPVMDINV